MNPIIQICFDLKSSRCTQPRPCNRKTMSAEANKKRKVTNVLGGTKFSPSFITGTLVPNRRPASIVAASPLRSTILAPAILSIMDPEGGLDHTPYLTLFLMGNESDNHSHAHQR